MSGGYATCSLSDVRSSGIADAILHSVDYVASDGMKIAPLFQPSSALACRDIPGWWSVWLRILGAPLVWVDVGEGEKRVAS